MDGSDVTVVMPPSRGLQAIQMVGNMEPAAGRAKEAWLAPLQPALQQGASQMKAFITRLVGTEEEEGGGEGRLRSPPAAVVKEGLLFVHKTRGKGPLLSCAAKKLHFCLTGEALSFAKSPGAEVRGAQEEVEPRREWGGTEHHPPSGRGSAPSPWPTSVRPRRWRRRASGAATSCRLSTWMRTGSRRRPTCSARWDGTGVGMGGVSQPGHPISTPSPAAVCQRAEPVAVRPAQGVRQQPPVALRLPPRRLQGGQVDLLPPEGQDGYGGWPGCGAGVLVGCLPPRKTHRQPSVPQGWGATGPGMGSPCRTGVTPWIPTQRHSASSSTSTASSSPSGEPLMGGTTGRTTPCVSPAPQRLCLPRTLQPREKYWELVKMEDPQSGPQVCSEGSDEGDTWGNRGRNPQLPIPIRDALFGAS